MKKIIIDTDPGIDDALAILLALSAKDDLNVLALTTVNGNVGLDKVVSNAERILHMAKREDVPIYIGHSSPLRRTNEICADDFHGDDGLGNLSEQPFIDYKGIKKEGAVAFLIETATTHKKELTVVAIGPLTNIADAVEQDVKFAKNIKELVIMGGAENGGNMSPHAEFNFWCDPEAAKIVFAAGFEKITMVGLDATSFVYLDPCLRELLYLIKTPISRFIHDMTRAYADCHWTMNNKIGCELCDVLAIAYLLDEKVIETVDAFVDIETSGLCDGASVVYRKETYPDKTANCSVATKADTKGFFRLFFSYQFPEYKEIVEKIINKTGF